ncbi:MAG: hypothetical protein AVDCRST_MAG54-916, partial [uncultured Actinomycetospora sp.]
CRRGTRPAPRAVPPQVTRPFDRRCRPLGGRTHGSRRPPVIVGGRTVCA